MSRRMLKKGVLESLGRYLEPLDFVPRKSRQDYRTRTQPGAWFLHLALLDYGELHVTGDVAVRFDAVEELLSGKKETATLGAQLEDIARRPLMWAVPSVGDVDSVCRSIRDTFLELGMPFLEKYSNPETAFSALSRDDEEGRLVTAFAGTRAQGAIAFALVLGKYQQFHDLVAAKRRYLEEQNDFGLPKFVETADRLQHQFADKVGIRPMPPATLRPLDQDPAYQESKARLQADLDDIARKLRNQ